MDEMTEKREVPKWEPTTVVASCEKGQIDVPAITHPWCPGLAVTMADFGTFRVTHITTGKALPGGIYERASGACRELAEWAAIGRLIGISWETTPANEIGRILRERGSDPVPFAGATSTDADGTRPMTIATWMMCANSPFHDEFPWESYDESPAGEADEILRTLAPEAPAHA